MTIAFDAYPILLALAAWWQISMGMCLESGMHHWTRRCWLRKASLIHTVPTQFIYDIKLLIITGLCWTRRGRKRGKGLHWGKGQQGIFCLRLTMLLQMSSCCQSCPAELPSCLRQGGIPVISLPVFLCSSDYLSQCHSAGLSLREEASRAPRGSAHPFAPALPHRDRQWLILKYGVTGDIVCPGAFTALLSWRATGGSRPLVWQLLCFHVC